MAFSLCVSALLSGTIVEDSMKKEKIINEYFHGLEAASYEKVIRLFAKDAIVYSPLYGKIEAQKFYKDLFADTNDSKITLKNVFINPQNPNVAAAHFFYDWTLKDGSKAPFECVDVFTFDDKSDLIKTLTIIYDTAKTRKAFDQTQNLKTK